MPSDERISQELRVRYLHDRHVPPGDVFVDTRSAVVTIHGTVRTLYLRERARRIAELTPGVREVVNQLFVRPASKSSEQLRREVEQAVLLDSTADARDIQVRVDNGLVVVNGRVNSVQQKQLVEQAIQGVTGVREVFNRLRVLTPPVRPDVEIMVELKTVLERDEGLIGDYLYVQVKNGVVHLSGRIADASRLARIVEKSWTAGVKGVDTSRIEVRFPTLVGRLNPVLRPSVQFRPA